METNEVRQKLERMKMVLIDRIQRIESDKKRDEPIPQDFAEQAVAVENDEVLDALDEVELKELKQINLALAALDNGTYGTCTECDNGIGDKRLSALPFATKCINCV
jgi:RNA polymerase-binding protein DksA